MEATLIKLANGALVPADDESKEVVSKLPVMRRVRADIKVQRNYRFLQKFHCLVNLAYDLASERMTPREYKGHTVMLDKERFRKDLTVMAGFYTPVFRYDGTLILQPKSIAFGNMAEDEFERVYSAFIQVILDKVLVGMTGEQLQRAIDLTLSYDA